MEGMYRNPFRAEQEDRGKKIYVTTDVYTYLEATGREKLCKNLFDCDKWKVEPALLADLETETDPAKRNKIRGLIRAVSDFPPKNREIPEMLSKLDSETRLRDENWHVVEDALYSPAVGDDIEAATAHVETDYNAIVHRWKIAEDGHLKEQLHSQIERLRPIRDHLYFRRVHPEFARKLLMRETIIRRSAA